MNLNARQLETLYDIAMLRFRRLHFHQVDGVGGYGAPIDFGGTNGSHHSQTAKSLAKKGLVHRYKYGGYKGACWYRATDEGMALLRKHFPNDRMWTMQEFPV